MLYGMERTDVQCRLSVGLFHTYIEGCYYFVAYTVLSADVDTTQQTVVVDGERRYLVHIVLCI